MSLRGTETGSGRSSAAAKDALAMASSGEAIARCGGQAYKDIVLTEWVGVVLEFEALLLSRSDASSSGLAGASVEAWPFKRV